jgi:CO/xanthine dehydrogenase Mo-binding subunit
MRSACRLAIPLFGADTALTPDAGKTSASRQTYVSGKAAEKAARALRANDPARRQCGGRRGAGA